MIPLDVLWRLARSFSICVLLTYAGWLLRGVTDEPVVECKHEISDSAVWVLRDSSGVRYVLSVDP